MSTALYLEGGSANRTAGALCTYCGLVARASGIGRSVGEGGKKGKKRRGAREEIRVRRREPEGDALGHVEQGSS